MSKRIVECCLCSEYQNPKESYFYKSIGYKYNIHCRIITETKYWYAIPTIGCLTVGYILLVCKVHYTCLAEVPKEVFYDFLCLKKIVTNRIGEKIGLRCVCFEHGSKKDVNVGANSIEHVHFHIVPSKITLWDIVIENTNITGVEEILNISELPAFVSNDECVSYLFLQDINNRSFLVNDASRFPSQFFRTILADSLDFDDMWDWRKYPFEDNIVRTLKLLG